MAARNFMIIITLGVAFCFFFSTWYVILFGGRFSLVNERWLRWRGTRAYSLGGVVDLHAFNIPSLTLLISELLGFLSGNF